jgi:hypothetical protein
MLVGCDKKWPALRKWMETQTLLRRFDNESHWDIFGMPKDTPWSEFLDYYATNVTHDGEGYRFFYKLKDGYLSREVHQDYSIPQPFIVADVYAKLPQYEKEHFPRDFGPMHWFLMANRGTGTLPHMDPHYTDAWNSLLYGHTWWIVYPNIPPEIVNEDETMCFPLCSTYSIPAEKIVNNGEERSWYSSAGLHAHKMCYGDKSPMQILQSPGETIYLPYGYVHSASNMDGTIGITQNYGTPASRSSSQGMWDAIVNQRNDGWKQLIVL